MRKGKDTSRREFLKSCLAGAVALGAAESGLADASAATAPVVRAGKSRVVWAEDARLRGAGGRVDAPRVRALLDAAMRGLFGVEDATRAWARVARPGQRVGVKVNTLGGRGLSTNVMLVEAICERLQGAGVRAQDIVVWDRDTAEMERAGFRVRMGGDGVQCYGTDRVGYEDELSAWGAVGSRVSRVVTRHCDVLVNVPVLKDHDGAGVTLALKNLYGAIHNPNKYHPNGCDPYIADVNMLEEIRRKLRLHVCDATTACYEGGPGFKPQFVWRANAVMVSQDPVALDTMGWRRIEARRAAEGLKTLEADGRAPRYLATAADAEHRLGTNDVRRIALLETRLA